MGDTCTYSQAIYEGVFLDNTVHMCTDEELQLLHGDELPAVVRATERARLLVEAHAELDEHDATVDRPTPTRSAGGGHVRTVDRGGQPAVQDDEGGADGPSGRRAEG